VKLEWVGWLATALFASSYFFKHPLVLRKVQAGAALLWVIYGLIIHAFPVVVANLVVASVALYSGLSKTASSSRGSALGTEQRSILSRD
jgi:hypothetical protein